MDHQMRKLFLALAALLWTNVALAQIQGDIPPKTVVGNSSSVFDEARPVPFSNYLDTVLGGTVNDVIYRSPSGWIATTVNQLLITVFGGTRGSILELGSAGWQIVPPAAGIGWVWASNGVGADPSYQPFGQNNFTMSGPGTVSASICGNALRLNGNAFFQIILGAGSGYPTGCTINIYNDDIGRFKVVLANGFADPDGNTVRYVAPSQRVTANWDGAAWHLTQSPLWNAPGGTLNLYAAFSTGSDTWGNTDGLAVSSPFKTVEAAILFAMKTMCFNGPSQTRVTINMAAGQNDTSGLHFPVHDFCAANGGAALVINGSTLPVTGAASHGGLIQLTTPSTASLANGETISVYGVGGTTEANASWAITVIDATHIDLQNSVFTNTFTSAGTMTNGSGFATTNLDAMATYFSTVATIQNIEFITITAGNCWNISYHSHIYIGQGVLFRQCATAAIITNLEASVEFTANVGVGSSQFLFIATKSSTIVSNGFNCDVVNTINATTVVLANENGTVEACTFVTHGYVVAGKKWEVDNGGVIATGPSGIANNDIPGTTNGIATSGGIENTHPLSPTAGGTGGTAQGQILGTGTNDNASVGNIGEYVSASVPSTSTIPLTNNAVINVAQISLTAGDWDVRGIMYFSGAAGTVLNYYEASVGGSATAIAQGAGQLCVQVPAGTSPFSINGSISCTIAPFRFSLAASGTISFNAQAGFSGSTLAAWGIVAARRAR